jgi:RNA polymerase sigma factor (sigma-70 family)
MPRNAIVGAAHASPRGKSARSEIARHLAFEVLVERHRRELLAYLTRVLGNRADAEDACQDALLRAHRAYETLRDRSHVRAWLFTIATRVALNARRRHRRSVAHHADVDPDALPTPSRQRGIDPHLYRAVESLPGRQRAALMQRIFHDQSYDEIGATLDCTAEAARANVYQAIKRLRAALRPNVEC